MIEILIDTNILVYACDPAEPEKRKKARHLLARLQAENMGCFSVQCIAEFFHATRRGSHPILTVLEASEQAEVFLASFPTFPLTPMVIINAIRGVREHKFAYYDAQIWACAHLNQVSIIFSEDFSDGQEIEGVRFVNPFSETFELEKWL